MKVERSSAPRAPRQVAAAYGRKVEAAGGADAVEPVPASVLGIPEAEFTPRVRDAIMGLMSEVDTLRRELGDTRKRLDEVEKAADQDGLLPLLNRRAFVRELTRYIAFTGRYNTPASLIYFDLNHMKKVNDTHGHAAGDAVLKHFAEVLQAHVRDSDLRLFLDMAKVKPTANATDTPLTSLAPAFMLSELKRAFEIGFLLFVPFLIIDMAVASILMSMGMMMLPPVIISLPFKLIFFVLVDGWKLVASSLVQSYPHSPPHS